jgi:hypothetical protein
VNVDQIYQLQRDDAFACQFSAKEYSIFVAMPFTNRGGYPEGQIRKLLGGVHVIANKQRNAKGRRFARLHRVDDVTSGSIVITDEIIRHILSCHFFVADLTGCNFGVVLEVGVALALKPNARVILFTQDDTASLHFDLKVTKVNRYVEENLVENMASELVKAAKAFENEADRYIRLISTQLTPNGIAALNIYGRLWKDRKRPSDQPSIWEDSAASYSSDRFGCSAGKVAFHNALRELSERRLFWTHYVPNAGKGTDRYGVHATNLGWRVIENLWKHDPQMRQPNYAPTGPNLA